MSWCDKYKPQKAAEIVGRVAEVRAVTGWLTHWPGLQGKKALLLSGPPGSGKTVVAEVVLREVGFSMFYIDATASKGKKELKERVREFTQSQNISHFWGKAAKSTKQCLVVEVDKLREQAELVDIVKTTKAPIICMCNDREQKNLRTLRGHCLEIQFGALPPAAVLCHASKVLAREGAAKPPWLSELAACGDMRLVLNTLQFKGGSKKDQPTLHFRDAAAKLMAPGVPFSAKGDLYLVDPFLMPLTVHDTYPTAVAPNDLEALAKAADALSQSDLCLTSQSCAAYLSCVAPLSGANPSRARVPFFPSWPGKNSTTTKNKGLLSSLSKKIRVPASELILTVLPCVLRDKVTLPLIERGGSGAPEVKEFLQACGMDRDDWQHIADLSLRKPVVPSAAKAALTRLWNAKQRKRKAAAAPAPRSAGPRTKTPRTE